jgi:dihydroxy-acid dehydratase
LVPSAGTCGVMGTASTMACIAEVLGIALPGSATVPAVHGERLALAEQTGRRIVELIENPILPSKIITEKSVENAFTLLMAICGSSNAIIHLTAIAGRLGISVSLEKLNRISDKTPVLVNLKPAGEGYMEDFHAAGGVRAVLKEIKHLLHLDTLKVSGLTLGEIIEQPVEWVDRSYIKDIDSPVYERGGIISLKGNLAPDGAIFKRAATTPEFFEHVSRAVVFDGLEDLANRIDAPDLDVKPDDILVLKNAGPVAAGMPEAGYIPIPKNLPGRG